MRIGSIAALALGLAMNSSIHHPGTDGRTFAGRIQCHRRHPGGGRSAVRARERTQGDDAARRCFGVAQGDRQAGAAFDVTILVGNLDDLVKQGKVAAGTPVALGRSGYGLAVRHGAPKPDISTTEAFKRTMLNATSIGYTKGGGSGEYFVKLLDRLGIAEAMKPKLRPGTNMQAAVARGEIEMTVNGIVPILRVPGIELVGPLPPELQSYSTFYAGVSAATKGRRTPRWRC